MIQAAGSRLKTGIEFKNLPITDYGRFNIPEVVVAFRDIEQSFNVVRIVTEKLLIVRNRLGMSA